VSILGLCGALIIFVIAIIQSPIPREIGAERELEFMKLVHSRIKFEFSQMDLLPPSQNISKKWSTKMNVFGTNL
jgi:hypothetical protein